MVNFNEKLKKALKDKGISQKQLVGMIGMTEGGFISMLNNNSIKVETLEKICETLDIPITYFLDIQVEPEGFWKRMINELSEEVKNLRMRAYRAEEVLQKHGIGNFNCVSKSTAVLAVA